MQTENRTLNRTAASRCTKKHQRRRKSPIAWVGGKSKLADAIIERIPPHVCYVEPFAGAGWVFFKKDRSKSEALNDINKDLVTFYRVLKNHPKALADEMRWLITARAEFDRLQRTDTETLTDIQRAARFYYIVKTSFGSKFDKATFGVSKTGKPRFNPNADALLADFEPIAQRLSRCIIENLGYAECIDRYDRETTFFYIDPPYWDCEDYYGKGLFSKDDFTALAEQLASIKGKFIMSLNDTAGVRETFADFKFEKVQTRYNICSVANQVVGEVLISNF